MLGWRLGPGGVGLSACGSNCSGHPNLRIKINAVSTTTGQEEEVTNGIGPNSQGVAGRVVPTKSSTFQLVTDLIMVQARNLRGTSSLHS